MHQDGDSASEMFYKPPEGTPGRPCPALLYSVAAAAAAGRRPLSSREKQRKMCRRRVRSKKSIVKTRDGHQSESGNARLCL